MLKKFLFSIFIAFSFLLSGQDINTFYFEMNEGRKLAVVGKIDSAITAYEEGFKKLEYVQTIYLQKVLQLAKLNNDLERIEKYSNKIAKQSRGTNPYLIEIVDSLSKEDQKIRKHKFYRKAKYAAKWDRKQKGVNNSKRYKKSKKLLNYIEKTDSSNIHHLLSLFDEYGFLGEELVGKKGYLNVRMLLLHFDDDTNNLILEPYLNKAWEEGKILPTHYAEIQDRHLRGVYYIQKYWMWRCIEKEKLQFVETDIPKIIKLRESIGIYDLSLRQEEYKGLYRLISKDRWKLVNYYYK